MMTSTSNRRPRDVLPKGLRMAGKKRKFTKCEYLTKVALEVDYANKVSNLYDELELCRPWDKPMLQAQIDALVKRHDIAEDIKRQKLISRTKKKTP